MGFLFPSPLPSFEAPPEISDEDVAEERRRQLALRGNKSATIINGNSGVGGPILGAAASLSGAGV